MPDSPPKRITRSRAKAAEMARLPAARNVKVAAPPAKSTTTKTTAGGSKRKAARDEVPDVTIVVDSKSAVTNAPPAKRARGGRAKKAAADDADTQVVSVPPLEDEAEVPLPTPAPIPAPKRLRARSKKTEDLVTTEPALKPVARAPTTERLTRGRLAAPARAAGAPVKKVTFEEQVLDKENRIPPARAGVKRRAVVKEDDGVRKPPGLNAKPIRRAASTRATRGATKAGRVEEPAKEPDRVEVKPLSPKKTQHNVPVLSSSSEEDELAGEETPMKPLLKSPVKLPPSGSVRGSLFRPELALSATRTTGPASVEAILPEKTIAAPAFSSPARKPPPSPFKDALKNSPKRVNMCASFFSQSASKRPGSALKPSSLDAPRSPMKMSLLSSPARRPPTSPDKTCVSASPKKHHLASRQAECSTISMDTEVASRPMIMSPQRNLTAAFRASMSREKSSSPRKSVSPERSAHPEESEPAMPGADDSPFLSRPAADAKMAHLVEQPLVTEDISAEEEPVEVDQIIKDDSNLNLDDNLQVNVGDTLSPLKPASLHSVPNSPTHDHNPTLPGGSHPNPSAFHFGTPATRYPSDDSDSDDELHRAMQTSSKKPSFQHRLSSMVIAPSPLETPTVPKSSLIVSHSLRRQAVQGHLFDRNATTTTTTNGTPSTAIEQVSSFISMTPLARQLENWKASTPKTVAMEQNQRIVRGLFSPNLPQDAGSQAIIADLVPSLCAKGSFFDDEMSVRENTVDTAADDDKEAAEEHPNLRLSFSEDGAPEPSEASQEYGDENAVPIDPILLESSKPHAPDAPLPKPTCTPARVFSRLPQQHVIHTVCKVPLKAAAEDYSSSPTARPAKRSHSLGSGTLLPRDLGVIVPSKRAHDEDDDVSSVPVPVSLSARKRRAGELSRQDEHTPTRVVSIAPTTPVSAIRTSLVPTGISTTTTTPAAAATECHTLKGAVVYVDVHTSEGADASGLFVELLTQMGARCVKQWNWNPNAAAETFTTNASDETKLQQQKIGITHVVFKDGGKRTLEKVRESKGVVLCVGVGWVLDCERHNAWLDETGYAVDISLVPRGGHRRRKSMEPRALSSSIMTTSMSTITTTTTTTNNLDHHHHHQLSSPTKQSLNLSTSSPPEILSTPNTTTTIAGPRPRATPRTPPSPAHTTIDVVTNDDDDDSSFSTPYFLRPSQITQRTCPAGKRFHNPIISSSDVSTNDNNHHHDMMFHPSGEDFTTATHHLHQSGDEALRKRLAAARRKTLMWRPKVGSPLARS